MTGPTARYRLAGVVLGLVAGDPTVAALVDDRLAPLALATDDPAAVDVVVEVRGPGGDPTWPVAPAGPLRPVYDAPAGSIGYDDAADELFIDYQGRVRFRCVPAAARIEIGIVGDDPGDAVLATHPVLTIALLETWKRFDRFGLHAGAVARDGRCLLLAGSSGSGKSTLTVAAVRAGWGFLADDTVFAESGPDGIVVWGFPDEVDVTPTTVGFFPELAHLADRALRPERDKHGFRVEDVYGTVPTAACRPAALVFPRITGAAEPVLEPLAGAAALLQLTPNVLLTDPTAAQAHLDLLGRAARELPAYTLHLGADLGAAVAVLDGLLGR